MDSALSELIADHARAVVPPERWPTPAPAHGQSHAEWLAEIARLREQHNATALQRERLFGAGQTHVPVGTVSYEDIPVAGGMIAARIYTPAGVGPFPAIAFLHGGGWWMGGGAVGFDLNDALCRALCADLPAVVVNADFRLAPEYRYPSQLDDVSRALAWIREQAGELRVDPDRLGVLGISSGGNLAAAVTLLSRDRGGPPIRAQFLLAPALDATASSPSLKGETVTYRHKLLVRELYTYGQPDVTLPYISPLYAADLAGLPPAVVVVGEFDPLREEATAYARRLSDSGVRTALLAYPMTHTVELPENRERWQRELIAEARSLL